MRRIRHLEQCDYVIPIGQRNGQILALSNQSNVLLERTWHNKNKLLSLKTHASFDSDNFNGFYVNLRLDENGSNKSFSLTSIDIYFVDQSDWSEVFILSKPVIQMPDLSYTVHVTSSDLSSYDPIGQEVFLISANATRKRAKFLSKTYFNHLGIYDSVFTLKQDLDFTYLTKRDE